MGKIFRLVYGAHRGTIVSRETLEAVQRDLQESGIKAEISDDINRDTFVKWSFISAMAVTGAYYDVPMGEVQKPGKVRDTFIGLSQESAALGRKLGIEFKEDIVQYNLKVIDKLAPRRYRLHAERYGQRASERSTRLVVRHDYGCRGTRD